MKSKADEPVHKTDPNIDGVESKKTLTSPLEQIFNFPAISFNM